MLFLFVFKRVVCGKKLQNIANLLDQPYKSELLEAGEHW